MFFDVSARVLPLSGRQLSATCCHRPQTPSAAQHCQWSSCSLPSTSAGACGSGWRSTELLLQAHSSSSCPRSSHERLLEGTTVLGMVDAYPPCGPLSWALRSPTGCLVRSFHVVVCHGGLCECKSRQLVLYDWCWLTKPPFQEPEQGSR
jgi:hypothetical protein